MNNRQLNIVKHLLILTALFFAALSRADFDLGMEYYEQGKLEKAYQKEIRKNSFYNELKEILLDIKPDKLFCSHQRSLHAPTVFAAAADLGIVSFTVVFSWDNLPKARMALKADHYLVWSDYMKQELQLYYPEIKENAIHVTGTPQFEFYGKPEMLMDKEAFYKQYNLDFNRKIICYSGDDVKTSPDDPKYLDDLASELRKSGLDKEYQILLRRCPVDLSGRFDNVVTKYNDLIKEAPPLWMFKSSSEWSSVYPSYEDVSLLVSTVYYSSIVVNVGSTMAFDFAMFDKPCIFINYDQSEKKEKNWSVKTIYQYQHFRSMPSKEAVLWLNSSSEIVSKITTEACSPSMKEWERTVVADFKNASTVIKTLLNT